MTVARLHITGASCTGTSTLGGAALAQRLGVPHLDTDRYYWAPTDPPFTIKRPPVERVRLIEADQGAGGWVLSGSLMGWGGEAALSDCDLILFLTAPPWEVRRTRLIAREQARFGGDRIAPGGDMHAIHTGFLDWASRYDDPAFAGRSRARHEDWLGRQGVPVLHLDATRPRDALTEDVLSSAAP